MNDLQKQIDSLQKFVESLGKSNTIPRDVETALRQRLLDIRVPTQTITYTTTNVPSGGGTVNVPVVNNLVPIIINGRTYNLLAQ